MELRGPVQRLTTEGLGFDEENFMATAAISSTNGRNFINGKWVDSGSKKFFERRNPANIDEVVARAPQSSREEMREAIAAAKAAFPGWRDNAAPVRGLVPNRARRLT